MAFDQKRRMIKKDTNGGDKMNLAVFVSDLRTNECILDRLKAEKVGVFLVGGGVYHATIKENNNTSPVLDKKGVNYYVLLEDLQTRGFTHADVNNKVNIVNYEDIVNLIMNDYEKLIWL